MRWKIALSAVVIFCSGLSAGGLDHFDRSGSVYFASRMALSFPAGALASSHFGMPASSWREEGITVSFDVGWHLTNSTIFGIAVSYSNFNSKDLPYFANDQIEDNSRVRVRRTGIFMQYQMVPSGVVRPFLKLGFGFAEIDRISFPAFESGVPHFGDHTISAKPVFSGGTGLTCYFSRVFSLSLTLEAVSMNTFRSSWETSGKTIGPLYKNLLFFPLSFGIRYHITSGT